MDDDRGERCETRGVCDRGVKRPLDSNLDFQPETANKLRAQAEACAANSDAAQETAGVKGVGEVELALDSLHEGEGIAGSPPSVERKESSGPMKENERAAQFLKARAQGRNGMAEVFGGAIEAETAESCGVDKRFPADAGRISNALKKFDNAGEVGRKKGNLGDGK